MIFVCKQCQIPKESSEFYRDATYTSGFDSSCKACRKQAHAAWRAKHPDYMHQYHEIHKIVQNARKAAKRLRNRDAINAQARAARHGPRREQILVHERTRYQRHKVRFNARRRERYYTNHAHSLAVARAYSVLHKHERRLREQANPHIYQVQNARYRARKAAAPCNDFTAKQWLAMKVHYGNRCAYCKRKMQRLTQDHITPLSKGGAHTYTNIIPACQSCNSRKATGAPLVPIQPLLLIVI